MSSLRGASHPWLIKEESALLTWCSPERKTNSQTLHRGWRWPHRPLYSLASLPTSRARRKTSAGRLSGSGEEDNTDFFLLKFLKMIPPHSHQNDHTENHASVSIWTENHAIWAQVPWSAAAVRSPRGCWWKRVWDADQHSEVLHLTTFPGATASMFRYTPLPEDDRQYLACR